MKITNVIPLKKTSEKRIWEGSAGGYVVWANAEIETDESVFGHVTESGKRRLVQAGELQDALNDTMPNHFHRVGNHPFEVTGVKNERHITIRFRSGYTQ